MDKLMRTFIEWQNPDTPPHVEEDPAMEGLSSTGIIFLAVSICFACFLVVCAVILLFLLISACYTYSKRTSMIMNGSIQGSTYLISRYNEVKIKSTPNGIDGPMKLPNTKNYNRDLHNINKKLYCNKTVTISKERQRLEGISDLSIGTLNATPDIIDSSRISHDIKSLKSVRIEPLIRLIPATPICQPLSPDYTPKRMAPPTIPRRISSLYCLSNARLNPRHCSTPSDETQSLGISSRHTPSRDTQSRDTPSRKVSMINIGTTYL